MTKKDDGGEAFPTKFNAVSSMITGYDTQPGMTLRDYFAGQAVIGLALHREVHKLYSAKMTPGAIARMAYTQAEAMIAEKRGREK